MTWRLHSESNALLAFAGGLGQYSRPLSRSTTPVFFTLVILLMRSLLVFLALTLLSATVHAEWFHFHATAMTTRIDVELWSDSAAEAERVSQQVFAEFDRIEAVMTRYRPESELSGVNRDAFGKAIVISPELFRMLETAQGVSRLSDDAFDISFASVGYLYDYRAGQQPGAKELAQHVGSVDYRQIRLNAAEHSVQLMQPGMLLDLGGIAKGYAVDQGVAILQKANIKHAQLSAGGDMRLLGDKRGKPWIVGIRDPRAESGHATVLPLSDVAVSTSGDYERFFIDDKGERIHHILSPKTGKPVKGVQSVTIIGPDATTTDGLSTAVFVLGVEKGLALINRLDGIDAIIIDEQRKLHYSGGLAAPGQP